MAGGGDHDHRAFLADLGEIVDHLPDLMVVSDHDDEHVGGQLDQEAAD